MKERAYNQKFSMIRPVIILVIIFATVVFAMIYFHADPALIRQTAAAENGGWISLHGISVRTESFH